MRIVIPSLARWELICGLLTSIQTHSPNIPIDIFIIETEYKEYEKTVMKYPGLNISIVVGKIGLVNQRNFIRDFYPEGEELIISDDDTIIKSDIHECSKAIFENMRNHKILLTGISPTNNPYFNRNRTQDITNFVSLTQGLYFCYGCFYWEINCKNKKLYLDLKNDELEDYHRSIQHFLFLGKVARYWPIIVKHNMFKPGGMQTNIDYEGRINNHNLAVADFYARYKFFCYTKFRNHVAQIVFKSLYKSEIFIKYELSPLKNGMYYDIHKNLKQLSLNTIKYIYHTQNTDQNNLIAIVIPEIFNFIPKPTPDAIELLRVASNKKNMNRGDIAGLIHSNKLPDFAIKYMLDKDYHLNDAGTRILFKGDGFDMSNVFRSYTLGYTTRKSNVGTLSHFDSKNTDRINTHLSQFFQDISCIYNNFYLKNLENYQKPSKTYLDTEFTAITVNNGARAAIHTDKYNRNFCAQLVLNHSKGSEYTGGDLIFPDYNLIIPNMQNNPALVLFDSSVVRHCVSEIKKINPDDTRDPSRMSLVFFQK